MARWRRHRRPGAGIPRPAARLHHRADHAQHPPPQGKAQARAPRPRLRLQTRRHPRQGLAPGRARPHRPHVRRLQRRTRHEPPQEPPARPRKNRRTHPPTRRRGGKPMNHLELITLNYLLNALWQIPVVFLVAALAARLPTPAVPQTEHRIWVAALLLEVVIPACAFTPTLRSLFFSLFQRNSGFVTTQTTILNATAGENHSHLTAIAASLALLAYAVTLLYLTGRLLYRLHR